MKTKHILLLLNFVKRCAELDNKEIDLILTLNTEETLRQLSEEAKKIVEEIEKE